MAGVSGWYGTAYECEADPSLSHGVGWYYEGQLISSTYQNPSTGKPYTTQELQALAGGTTPTGTTPTTTPTTTGGVPPPVQTYETIEDWYAATGNKPAQTLEEWQALNPGGTKEDYFSYMGGQISGAMLPTPGPAPTTAPTTAPPTMPTFGAGAAAGIPTPEIKPAPPYEISPEQKAWQEEYGAKLTDWVKNPQGIPEETQAQMIQLQTDTLKAREQENIRIMKNNMERRGITNSGYIDANMHMITSNTTVALAGAIADVQIKSALMKMASFEKAMGAASQFLGYLSEQSQLAYAPEFATWQAEQLATMQVWQGKMDILKIDLNQAYQTQNIQLQAQLTSQLAAQQHGYDIELAEMELDAQKEAAKAEGAGNLIGTVSGAVATIIAK